MSTGTWESRLQDSLGPGGYENSMRRSLQTVILYEAVSSSPGTGHWRVSSFFHMHSHLTHHSPLMCLQNRCITAALPTLRPFQRKIAYIDMANALVNSLSGLMTHQKAEVLWRTGTSKEPMNAETAWKRRKLLNKELENIRDAVTPLLVADRTHDEALDHFIQQQFVSYRCCENEVLLKLLTPC
jgi:hypothetical protein